MSRLARRLALALAIAGAVLAPAALADAAQEEQAIAVETVDVSAFPEVVLTLSVPPELAELEVPDQAFTLRENGAARVVEARRLGASQLDVVLVLDTSGSMRGEAIDAAKASARAFVDRLPAEAQVAVVGFSDTPAVVSPYSTDRAAIGAAIDGLVATGETALYDAMLTAAELAGTGAGQQHSIVVLSDGGDTVSAAPIEQAVERLAGANAGITVLELVTTESDRASLDRLAQAASGRVVGVGDPGSLDAAYASIAERLSNLYEIRFTSSGATRADLAIGLEVGGFRSSIVAPVEFPEVVAAPSAPVPVTEPAAPTPFVVDPGPLSSGTTMLAVGAGLVLVGALVVLVIAIGDRTPQRHLADEYDDHRAGDQGLVNQVASQAVAFGERIAASGGQTASLDTRLDDAGLALRAGELVAIVLGATLAAAAFGFLVLGPFGFVCGLVLVPVLAPVVLSSLRDRRRARFGDQLGDALVLMTSSLRSGYGIVQSVDVVARETEPPMSTEFTRVMVETRLGRDLDDALRAVVRRTGSDDLEWVVDAIDVHRSVGGDLAEVLDHVGATIRARTRIARQVEVLSAEGRISALVLMALPFAVALFIAVSNPDYLRPLIDTTAGNLMLAGAFALLVGGGVWMRRIIRMEF